MKTKILIIVLVVVCVLLAAVAGVLIYRSAKDYVPSLDYEKLYKAHQPDETVAYAGDEEISWDRYYNVFAGYAQQLEYYMTQMETYYGKKIEWDDVAGEDGSTFAEQPKLYAEDLLKQSGGLSRYAEAVGTEYKPDDENSVYELFKSAFGENGERLGDDEALEWMNDKGYVHVIHILFMTKNRETGEAVDQDTIIEKKALAQEKYEELSSIENDMDRLAAFRTNISEYNEDPGMITFPDGYTFLDGSMYAEFCSAAKALKDYEVSEPVETVAGYHIIMRLPLNPDEVLFENYVNGDTTSTARLECAYEKFDKTANEYYEKTDFNYIDGFNVPNIKEYLKRYNIIGRKN